MVKIKHIITPLMIQPNNRTKNQTTKTKIYLSQSNKPKHNPSLQIRSQISWNQSFFSMDRFKLWFTEIKIQNSVKVIKIENNPENEKPRDRDDPERGRKLTEREPSKLWEEEEEGRRCSRRTLCLSIAFSIFMPIQTRICFSGKGFFVCKLHSRRVWSIYKQR